MLLGGVIGFERETAKPSVLDFSSLSPLGFIEIGLTPTIASRWNARAAAVSVAVSPEAARLLDHTAPLTGVDRDVLE